MPLVPSICTKISGSRIALVKAYSKSIAISNEKLFNKLLGTTISSYLYILHTLITCSASKVPNPKACNLELNILLIRYSYDILVQIVPCESNLIYRYNRIVPESSLLNKLKIQV